MREAISSHCGVYGSVKRELKSLDKKRIIALKKLRYDDGSGKEIIRVIGSKNRIKKVIKKVGLPPMRDFDSENIVSDLKNVKEAIERIVDGMRKRASVSFSDFIRGRVGVAYIMLPEENIVINYGTKKSKEIYLQEGHLLVSLKNGVVMVEDVTSRSSEVEHKYRLMKDKKFFLPFGYVRAGKITKALPRTEFFFLSILLSDILRAKRHMLSPK